MLLLLAFGVCIIYGVFLLLISVSGIIQVDKIFGRRTAITAFLENYAKSYENILK